MEGNKEVKFGMKGRDQEKDDSGEVVDSGGEGGLGEVGILLGTGRA